MRKLLFILTAVVVIILVIALFILFQVFQQPRMTPTTIPIPTKIPQGGNSTPAPHLRTNLDLKKADDLVDAATNRQTLSAAGTAAKTKLISSLNNSSGVVYTSPTVKISYIASPDLFQSEILSADDTAAKQEAVNWMLSQGFTQDDLCKLPFSFFLGPVSSQKYLNSNNAFNPLPEGC